MQLKTNESITLFIVNFIKRINHPILCYCLRYYTGLFNGNTMYIFE